MKALTCEMCGSTNIIKEDGLYVCQSCGTRYSPEEAKKMVIDGPVTIKGKIKIDKSDDINNYRQLARRARQTEDKAKALKFYDKILESNANDPEACFYSAYYTILVNLESYLPSDIESTSDTLCSTIKPFLLSIKETITDEQTLIDEVFDIQQDLISLSESLFDYIRENSNYASHGIDTAKDAVRGFIYEFGDAALSVFGDPELSIPAWMHAVENITSDDDELKETYIKKIAQYHEDYVPHKAGCYIATSIYGSYDCPEVWTLRRFRDDTLARTWHGRIFIYSYYAISPFLVEHLGNKRIFKLLWRPVLDNLVSLLKSKGVSSMPYRDKKIK